MSFVVVNLGFHLTSHCCSKMSDFLLALHIKKALRQALHSHCLECFGSVRMEQFEMFEL